jgi:uncharacterized membrane protein
MNERIVYGGHARNTTLVVSVSGSRCETGLTDKVTTWSTVVLESRKEWWEGMITAKAGGSVGSPVWVMTRVETHCMVD